MSRKRRMFDIDMPVEAGATNAPRISTTDDRRGPMASAVRENADSLKDRAERERAIRVENDALAHEFVSLKAKGLVLESLPVVLIDANKLTRDRRSVDDGHDLQELKESITSIGLSNPIQVERDGDRYQLVQGFRRLSAIRALGAETGDERYREIPCVVLEPGESLQALYRRMVDENLIRKDISFAEMAALARAYAKDEDTSAKDADAAVAELYGSANKQKRSYIRAFVHLLDVLEKSLQHPDAISRNLGLAVRKRLEGDPASLAKLQRSLTGAGKRSVAQELEILRDFATTVSDPAKPEFPVGNSEKPSRPREARTTFQVQGGLGTARCTASQGRLELRLGTDFSAIPRQKLEKAVQRFLQDIDDG